MEELDSRKVLSKTFFWMFLGLLGTGLVAFYTYSSGLYLSIFTSVSSLAILALVEVVVVIVFSLCFRKLPPTVVGILYFVYAFLNGFTFSSIFAVYEISSIMYVFLLTSILYAVLAFCGYKTKIDVSKWSTILFVALIVSLIASIVNLFLGNTMVDIVISWIVIFIFAGYTIYDMHVLRELSSDPSINQDKVYIYCAMQLYLDFINLFIRLLRIFGKSID